MDYIKSYIPFISFRISAYKVIYFLSNDTNESYLIGLTFFDTYAVPMYDGNSCISTFFVCKIHHYLGFFFLVIFLWFAFNQNQMFISSTYYKTIHL